MKDVKHTDTETKPAMELELAGQPSGGSNLLAVIERAASNPQIDVDKMERLLQMQERIVAKQAEEAFNNAMAAAQAEMPRVQKNARNTSTNSWYVKLETLNEAVIPIYTSHGFSLSFGTADCPVPEHIRITCMVSHSGGHSRKEQCDLPNDWLGAKGNPSKTKMHGAGSTFSYGRRYLTLMIFNVIILGEDDDGNRGEKPKPAGPSTLAAEHEDARLLVRELWGLLRGVTMEEMGEDGATKTVGVCAESNWKRANRYLFEMGILSDTEEVNKLPAKRVAEVIQEYKKHA